jgi:RimJ/RimL family protein N-acetyltransferase
VNQFRGRARSGRVFARFAAVRIGTLGLDRIHASHLARNPASGRVMEKLGMMREGIARQHTRKWDRHEDLVLYGVLKEEWKIGCEQ